jgi:hypothetical protein
MTPELEQFYQLTPSQRQTRLQAAILRGHAYHYERNAAYRLTLQGRGVSQQVALENFAHLLRPSALTFKSYAELMGPFPQEQPLRFLSWLNHQLSIPLPEERWSRLRPRYRNLEGLLQAVEQLYADLGIEIVTSSGTSGRASFVVRNGLTVQLAISAFFSGIAQAWDIRRGTALVFMMPAETRVAMARTARLGTNTLSWMDDAPVHYTIPFAATPDMIRIRAGRTYHPGLEGWLERRVLNPGMRWANDHLANPQSIDLTRRRLVELIRANRPIMLLGGMAQLHALAQVVKLRLPEGSRVATGGGFKESYNYTPAQIRADLVKAFGAPVSDVYGMAEANWAAFECPVGNHHIPPWVYAVVTDDDDHILDGPDTTGLLAFFDPEGGGYLIPPFFQTSDRIRLVNGASGYDPTRVCPCGEDTPYIMGEIQRVDLVEEAGCAAQV